jgi:hypothetical protein
VSTAGIARGTRPMRSKYATKIGISVLICFLSTAAVSEQRFVAGPIERLSANGELVTVLGQGVRITRETILSTGNTSISAYKAKGTLKVGTYALFEFADSQSGSIASRVSTSRTLQYVPGATPVSIGGKIEALSPENGYFRIGQLNIDFSTISPEIASQLAVGTFVTLEGTQPLPTGPIVGVYALSIGGSGIQSIGGSGLESIGGSGVESIGGSGAESIGGSGIQSIGGSGVASIGGSGVASIGGSGVLSIGGSGVKSIGGSGVASIGGSGVASIGGSGVLSIGGSGVKSIGGSGVQSIGGSGIQ